MKSKNLDFKNESCFFLKTFWTNGFSIWSAIMGITGLFLHVSIIYNFRESLWIDQLMWVFLVPMLYQLGFRYFLYPKINPKVKTSLSKLKIFFIYFVLTVIISSIIIEYAYFVVDTLLIIPQHHSEAQGSNYAIVPWLQILNWGFIAIFLAGERYKKHLVENEQIIFIQNKNLNNNIQISLIMIGFVLSLSAFVMLPTILNM